MFFVWKHLRASGNIYPQMDNFETGFFLDTFHTVPNIRKYQNEINNVPDVYQLRMEWIVTRKTEVSYQKLDLHTIIQFGVTYH